MESHTPDQAFLTVIVLNGRERERIRHSMATTYNWHGASGRRYEYYAHAIGTTSFNDVPGNYIFAKHSDSGSASTLYIGQTTSLRDRITASHEKWPCVTRNGVTHIHQHVNSNAANRLSEEQDLIQAASPPCND